MKKEYAIFYEREHDESLIIFRSGIVCDTIEEAELEISNMMETDISSCFYFIIPQYSKVTEE